MRAPLVLGTTILLFGGGFGCVHVRHDLTLQPDGSGLLDLRYAVNEQVLQGWHDGPVADGGAVFDPALIQEDFARYRPLGIRVLHSETALEEGWRHFRLLLRFESMEALNRTALYAQRSWALRKTVSGDYLLEQSPGSAGPLGPPGLNLSDPDADAELRAHFQGFKATLTVAVPGDIVRTNAHRIDGRTATWTYGGSPAGNPQREVQDSVQQIVFSGSGLALPEFGRQHVRLSMERP